MLARPSREVPRGSDPLAPASWIDAATGKPATAAIDMDTDLILPDSDKSYKVAFKAKGFKGIAHAGT